MGSEMGKESRKVGRVGSRLFLFLLSASCLIERGSSASFSEPPSLPAKKKHKNSSSNNISSSSNILLFYDNNMNFDNSDHHDNLVLCFSLGVIWR